MCLKMWEVPLCDALESPRSKLKDRTFFNVQTSIVLNIRKYLDERKELCAWNKRRYCLTHHNNIELYYFLYIKKGKVSLLLRLTLNSHAGIIIIKKNPNESVYTYPNKYHVQINHDTYVKSKYYQQVTLRTPLVRRHGLEQINTLRIRFMCILYH